MPTDNHDLVSARMDGEERHPNPGYGTTTCPLGETERRSVPQANPANGGHTADPYSDNDIAGAGPGTDWLD